MPNHPEHQTYILGLDIGSSSLGWSALKTTKAGIPNGVLACGVRVFPAGVEGIETGKDVSRSVERRQKRQLRRQLMRKARRMRKIFGVLMRNDLLPRVEKVKPEIIDSTLKQLDQELIKKWVKEHDPESHLAFPYHLRAAAAIGKLEPFELGRALYHLLHRRGFRSNRKSIQKDDEKLGQVHTGIQTLEHLMQQTNSITLGTYFASIASHEVRIRRRWTSRQMFLDEFTVIQKANPQIPTLVWKELHKAAFFQRKLKSQSHLIGKCSLLPDRRRSPMWHPEYQQFRIISAVNALRILDNAILEGSRSLDAKERATLTDALGNQKSMTASAVKKLLGIAKSSSLSIDEIGSGEVIGDRTACAMRKAFGESWNTLTPLEKLEAIHDVISFENEDALERRGIKHWKLPPEQAVVLSKIALEPGNGSVSVVAIGKLMPHLQIGLTYAEARVIAFPEQFEVSKAVDLLPPVDKFKDVIRNPAVARSLSELRLVVNSLIRKFGRPTMIRIELARELKKPKKQREQLAKDMRTQGKVRESHMGEILAKTPLTRPSRTDIQKVSLFYECGGVCPYTGRQISWSDLFGSTPQVQIEHIIPFSRSCDDSFGNKTLCFAEENMHRKKNQTPFEAYGSTPQWGDIVARVKRFGGTAAKFKLEKFLNERGAQEMAEQFSSRQLNDTRYASVLGRQYLSQLYGGMSDEAGNLRVQATAGQTTAYLRREWRLNLLLQDKNEKSRTDHRHHAIDATVIALTSPRQIQILSSAASKATGAKGQRLFAPIEEPWNLFFDEIKEKIQHETVVSHRASKRVAGSMHEDFHYRAPMLNDPESSFIRKHLTALTRPEIEKIVDPTLQELIKGLVGNDDPKKVFQGSMALPTITGKDGITRRIRRVRVKANRPTTPIGSGINRRFVSPGGNHHLAIYEVATKSGVKWQHKVTTRFEAAQRLRRGQAVIDRNAVEGSKFVCSFSPGECLAIPTAAGAVDVMVVKGCTANSGIEVLNVSDARMSSEIRDSKLGNKRTCYSAEKLRGLKAYKVVVSPIGQVFGAGG